MSFSIWRPCTAAVAILILVMAGTASGHHSFAMFNQDKLITLKGTIT